MRCGEIKKTQGGLLDVKADCCAGKQDVKQRLACRAPFQAEKLSPSAKLTTVHIPLRPSEALLAPLLGKRDALPNQRTIHSLLLTYKLTVVEAGKHTVRLPLLNKYARVPWDPSTVWGKCAWQRCWAVEALYAHETSTTGLLEALCLMSLIMHVCSVH